MIMKDFSTAIGVGKSSVSCPLKPSDSAPLKHSTMPLKKVLTDGVIIILVYFPLYAAILRTLSPVTQSGAPYV